MTFSPAWTPDGQRTAFGSERDHAAGDLFWQEVDGTGAAEGLLESPSEQVAFSWSCDGKHLLFWDSSKRGMAVLSMEGGPTARTLLEAPFTQSGGCISPDGRWLAYNSSESGKPEIFVQAFPELGRKMQISTDGGLCPL